MKFLAFSAAFVFTACASADAEPVEPIYYGYRILETYPHARDAFTQGLFFEEGDLYESTGQYGQSSLRKVDLTTGAVLQKTALPQSHFGEGAAIVDGDIFVLSWREGTAFQFDAEEFTLKNRHAYEGEGWGLTYNGEALVMSDGTAQLRFLSALDFAESRRLEVTLRGKPLPQLNELEWIDGEIYANVWRTNAVVRIDPSSGAVTGVIDLRGLLADEDMTPGETDVLNGVAWNGEKNILYVTGKNWPKLFKIELIELVN
ncbi:glutaminyl-peptide cyclotransferase [Hyphococcus sp.]|uniref:glutaminyl-peptide cyclotransferase n=1 Tax=Hyphococcus sp. TaxID=2038636 RepID=UPI00208D977B|nr:MAG: glutamine cyclotransferase [Marinicaulis sp.]